MLRRLRARLTYANVVATLALFLAIGTGGAYAANTIGSSDVIDESLLSQDIKNGEIKNADIGADAMTSTKLANGSVQNSDLGPDAITTSKIKAGNVGTTDVADGAITGAKVLDDSQPGGGLGSEDIRPLNGDADIQDNTITGFDIATDAIDSDEVVDFGLSNADVGVLFAQVNADGTIANSSGGVTGTKLGGGSYAIDFAHNVSSCGFVATQGEATAGAAGGAILGVTDRAGNANAAFVTTRPNAGGAPSDAAFQIVAVC